MEAETERSRFTLLPWFREPRLVRRSVSGETPTLKYGDEEEVEVEAGEGLLELELELENSVMVRHVPFTLMLSPREASVRIEAQSEMVIEVPLPPEEVESREERFVTAEIVGLVRGWY